MVRLTGERFTELSYRSALHILSRPLRPNVPNGPKPSLEEQIAGSTRTKEAELLAL